MPFGCFGKRRKRDKPDELAEKGTAGENGTAQEEGVDAGIVNKDATTKSASVDHVTRLPNNNTTDEPDEVSDVVTVARAHSLHASAPNTVEHRHTTIGIQKSATLARYDFLRKSDYASTADRWAALKQQYLTPTMSNSSSQHQQHNPSAGQNGSVVRRAAQSLPRQFAPPSTSLGPGGKPVRFSQWFYERQIKEVDARRDFQERDEKTRKLVEGAEDAAEDEDESPRLPEAAAATAADNDEQSSKAGKASDSADLSAEAKPSAAETPEVAQPEAESHAAAEAPESEAADEQTAESEDHKPNGHDDNPTEERTGTQEELSHSNTDDHQEGAGKTGVSQEDGADEETGAEDKDAAAVVIQAYPVAESD